MSYYENGYETVGAKELIGAPEIEVRFLPLECGLYIIGSKVQRRRAYEYLRRGLRECSCANDEFMLHFMCEMVCGVRIVKGSKCLMTA